MDELTTNENGDLVATPKSTLTRSWGRKDGYSGTFEYEGARIFIRLLSNEQWGEIEASEEELQEEGDKLTQAGKDLERRAALPDGDPEKDGLKEARKQYRADSMAVAEKMFAFQQDIVKRAVMGWKDAPVPFSAEALQTIIDGEREMVVEWAGVILEKSRLGTGDAKNSQRR